MKTEGMKSRTRLQQERRRVTAQIKAVRDWNDAHRIGTPCTVELDSGDIVATKTRSEAWMLSGHTAVVMLEGISGAYALERVRAKGGV